MSQIIKDEEELNNATDPDLRTEYFDLELLGLKSIVDLRKFSRSFMKIAKILFGIENNKLDKGDYTGNAKNLNDEISKKASSTQLGRMIVGTGLTDDGNGRVSHSTGAGNNHIPANGATGNFLKWLSNGVAQWANITWSDITGKPSTFTPASHTHDDKLDKGGYTGNAKNLNDEISKKASSTQLGRMIVGKGLTVDSSGRTSVVSRNDAIIVNDNDIQLNVYDGVDSTSTTRAASARAVKQANDNANGRVSKSGDTMTNTLNIKRNGIKVINFQEADESSTQVGYVGFGSSLTPREIQLRNAIANESFAIAEDGEYQFPTKTTTSSIDADDIIPSSDKRGIIYRIENNTHIGANFPNGAGAGILRVWRSYNTHIVQEYYNIGGTGNPNAWYRIRSSTTNWSSWKKFITDTDIINDLTTGGADKVASGETVKTLNSTKASKNGDTFTGLIKMKMDNPYIEFLNRDNERMGYVGYGATDRTRLQIINAQKENSNIKTSFSIMSNAALEIPYEDVPSDAIIDLDELIPTVDVSVKIYRIGSSSVSTNGANFPNGAGAGILRVTRTFSTQITQEYYSTASNQYFIRFKTTVWSSWINLTKKTNTVMFAKGTEASSDIIASSSGEVTLDIFKDRQFGDEDLAQYDSTDKTIKILKSGRYMINMAIYHVGTTGQNSFIFKLYKSGTLIDYTESRGSDIREKKNINLVYDLNANDKLKLTVANSTGNTLTIYTPKEYSRLQLTKISEIGGL